MTSVEAPAKNPTTKSVLSRTTPTPLTKPTFKIRMAKRSLLGWILASSAKEPISTQSKTTKN
jgi:hypothetical protein